MDESIRNLDQEFEQFLEIMQPHVSQLKNRELVSICSAWIQRLCACKGHEKILRNKYIVTLCYQLSKGILDKPFLEEPSEKDLLPIIEPTLSDISSSEVECLVLDSEDTSKANNKKRLKTVDPTIYTEELLSPTTFNDKTTSTESEGNLFNQTSYNHQQSNMIKPDVEQLPENYRYRTHNIISRVQEIQNQNTLLHHKLNKLKGKSSEDDSTGESQNKVSTSTLYMRLHDSSTTLDSLKIRLKEVQDTRNALINKVQSMQEFIDSMNDIKNQEIEEMQARHRLELINMKSLIKQETSKLYENKLEEQHQHFEVKIKELRDKNMKKDEIIAEKDIIIQQKESEIGRLTEQMKDSKENLNSILEKLIDRPHEEQPNHFRIQNDILQNRIIKMEKAKIKCVRTYESKLASLQRDRNLVECSFQIQLVRQRAQIVNDVADDCQNETKKAVDKLESKYQDIVANMQATAIQRRVEDQMAVASILKAASGVLNESYPFYTTIFPKSQTHLRRNRNRRSNGDVSTVFQGNKVFRNKNVNEKFEDEGRYEELGTLFEKVHALQRDAEDKARK